KHGPSRFWSWKSSSSFAVWHEAAMYRSSPDVSVSISPTASAPLTSAASSAKDWRNSTTSKSETRVSANRTNRPDIRSTGIIDLAFLPPAPSRDGFCLQWRTTLSRYPRVPALSRREQQRASAAVHSVGATAQRQRRRSQR